VNLALAAAASLLDSRALRTPAVRRVEIDPQEARALSREQLRALQRESDRLPSSRDRAIVRLLMLTGVRVGELAALEVDDVRLTQRTGELITGMARRIAGAWCRSTGPPGRRCPSGLPIAPHIRALRA
jgi:integrase